MKTFVVKILTSEGLEHHQLIADEDDVTILMEVIKKIERRANKLKAEVQEEAKVFSSNAVLTEGLPQEQCSKCGKWCTGRSCHECQKYW